MGGRRGSWAPAMPCSPSTSNISTSFKEFEQALYEAPIDILEKMDTPSFSIDCDEPGAFLEIKNWLTDVKKDAEYDVLDPLYVWDKTIFGGGSWGKLWRARTAGESWGTMVSKKTLPCNLARSSRVTT